MIESFISDNNDSFANQILGKMVNIRRISKTSCTNSAELDSTVELDVSINYDEQTEVDILSTDDLESNENRLS